MIWIMRTEEERNQMILSQISSGINNTIQAMVAQVRIIIKVPVRNLIVHIIVDQLILN